MNRFEMMNNEIEGRICQDENVLLISNAVKFMREVVKTYVNSGAVVPEIYMNFYLDNRQYLIRRVGIIIGLDRLEMPNVPDAENVFQELYRNLNRNAEVAYCIQDLGSNRTIMGDLNDVAYFDRDPIGPFTIKMNSKLTGNPRSFDSSSYTSEATLYAEGRPANDLDSSGRLLKPLKNFAPEDGSEDSRELKVRPASGDLTELKVKSDLDDFNDTILKKKEDNSEDVQKEIDNILVTIISLKQSDPKGLLEKLRKLDLTGESDSQGVDWKR